MQIKIHRGVDQIGGCITELKSKKTKILIDVGSELPNTEYPVKANVSKISRKSDAVFIIWKLPKIKGADFIIFGGIRIIDYFFYLKNENVSFYFISAKHFFC